MSSECKTYENQFSVSGEGVSREELKETLEETVPSIVKRAISEELVNVHSELEKVKETMDVLSDRSHVRVNRVHTFEDINTKMLKNVQENYEAIESLKQIVSRQRELLQLQDDMIRKQTPLQSQEHLGESGSKEMLPFYRNGASKIEDVKELTKSSEETIDPVIADTIAMWRQAAINEQIDARENGYHDLNGTHNIICLDVSESMREGDTWNKAEKFVKGYLNGMIKLKKEGFDSENVALLTFGPEVMVKERLTKDFEKLKEIFDTLTPSGPTQMFGCLLMAEAVALTSKFSFAIANDVHITPKIIFVTDGLPTGIIPFSADRDIGDPDTTKITKYQMIKEVERMKQEQVDVHCVYVGQGDSTAEEFLKSVSQASVNEAVMSAADGKKMAYHTISKCLAHMTELQCGPLESKGPGLLSLSKMLSPDDDDISSLLELSDSSTLEAMIERKTDFYKEIDDKRYPEIGQRVRRGKNWKWGDQDSRGVGTIIGHSPDQSSQLWLWVEWDADGEQNAYRWSYGSSKRSDLMIVDEDRKLEAGDILAVGTKVKKAETETITHTMIGVVIKLNGDEEEKALVRWKDKTRDEYYFGKGETPTEIIALLTKGHAQTEDKTVSSSVSLEIKEQSDMVVVPSSPEGPVEITEMLRNSVRLTWKKPNEEGTSSVTHFEIEFWESGKKYPLTIDRADAGAASVSHRLVHLKGNTEYVASIKAVNAVGYSKPLSAPLFKTSHYLELDNEDIKHTLMTEKHLARFVEAIGLNWDFIAVELDLNMVSLQQLRSNNCTTQTQILSMLMLWRQQKAEKATFGELIDGMKKAKSASIDWLAIENIAKSIKQDVRL